MQAEHRREPGKETIAEKRDIADETEDPQKPHILRDEGQKHHRRGPVADDIVYGHGLSCGWGCCEQHGQLVPVQSGSREAGRKKLEKDCKLRLKGG
jgi:hypothetical protein